MRGTIFNIQRYSLNDGPGIRTTVFFKGCPLHCKWCHNPESISARKEIILIEDRCIRCGDCFRICPEHAVQPDNSGFVTNREKCASCGRCTDVCYADARRLVGKDVTSDELMEEIMRDVVFYNESGGGVTFSGGEPLLQYEFLISLLDDCKRNNIHTAVDTSGHAPSSILNEISKLADIFLYDLKTLDDAVHKNFTGVSNELIIGNLRRLAKLQKTVIIRIPIIPSVNNDLEQIRQIGKFISSLKGIQEIHLLPYNRFVTDKYRRFGFKYPMENIVQPTEEDMNSIVKELIETGSRVVIGG